MSSRRQDLWMSLLLLGFGIVCVLIWIPNDIETGLIEKFRRQIMIGDALLPMVAALGVILCSALLIAKQFPMTNDGSDKGSDFDSLSLLYLASVIVTLTVSFGLMMWAGPAVLTLLGDAGPDGAISSYREMRDQAPWKYIGFILGGFSLVFALTSFIEGAMRWRRALSSLLAVIALILLFDVPFDNLLLPPNGDW